VDMANLDGKRGLISKKVEVLDCNCSYDGSKQAEASRYDYCRCKVRVQKGRKGAIVSATPDKIYTIGTVFIASHPARAWRGPE